MEENEKTFTIQCTMKDRWIPQFLSMLNYMQVLGDVGSSRKVALYADGDGDFRPKFKFNIPDVKFVDPVDDEDGDHLYDAS